MEVVTCASGPPCRCVSYITGALVSVFLAVALVDDALLTQVTLGGKNLLWYIAVCSAALAVSRALMYEPEEQMLDPKNAMRVVSVCVRVPTSNILAWGAFGTRRLCVGFGFVAVGSLHPLHAPFLAPRLPHV